MGVSGKHHTPAAFYPQGKDSWYPLYRRLGEPHTAALDAEAGRKILCLCRGSNPGHPVRSQSLYCLSYTGSSIFLKTKIKSKHTFSTTAVHALLCHTVASNRHSLGQKLKKGFCHYWIQYIHVTVYLKTTQDLDKFKKVYTSKKQKLTNCIFSI
jgi:hypothetical protein